MRDRAEAEDAAQQTFLAAHRALLNGSTPREPAAWLATIARNECWSRIRTRMREPLASEEIDTVSTAPDPLTEAIRRADLAALWRAIAELPRQQRDALLLREFGGLSYEELAEALAVTGPAVESLLFRARQGLRARLQTAYAAASGAGWAEALMRLLAGMSSTAAPVAAKVAVVAGVGAAVTGGVVVGPSVLDHHAPAKRAPAATAPRPVRVVQAAPPLAAATKVFVAARSVSTTVAAKESDHSGNNDNSGDRHDSGASGSRAEQQQASDGGQSRRTERDSGDRQSHHAAGSDGNGGDESNPSDPASTPPPPSSPSPAPTTTTATTTTTTSAGVTVPAPNPPVTVVPPPGDEAPGGDG